MTDKIDRLTAKCERLNRVYQAEKARGAGLGGRCAHCKANIQLRYTFCFRCTQKLPESLRNEISYNANMRASATHARAVLAATNYLNASDKDAFVREQMEAGADWAMDAMLESGELDYEGMMAIYRERAAARGENHD